MRSFAELGFQRQKAIYLSDICPAFCGRLKSAPAENLRIITADSIILIPLPNVKSFPFRKLFDVVHSVFCFLYTFYPAFCLMRHCVYATTCSYRNLFMQQSVYILICLYTNLFTLHSFHSGRVSGSGSTGLFSLSPASGTHNLWRQLK